MMIVSPLSRVVGSLPNGHSWLINGGYFTDRDDPPSIVEPSSDKLPIPFTYLKGFLWEWYGSGGSSNGGPWNWEATQPHTQCGLFLSYATRPAKQVTNGKKCGCFSLKKSVSLRITGPCKKEGFGCVFRKGSGIPKPPGTWDPMILRPTFFSSSLPPPPPLPQQEWWGTHRNFLYNDISNHQLSSSKKFWANFGPSQQKEMAVLIPGAGWILKK